MGVEPRAGARRPVAGAGVCILIAGAAAAPAMRDGFAGRLWAAADDRPRIAPAAILLPAALRASTTTPWVLHHETADDTSTRKVAPAARRAPAAGAFPDRYPPSQTRDFRWFGDR
jgi:hypothetical protein